MFGLRWRPDVLSYENLRVNINEPINKTDQKFTVPGMLDH